jgi:TolB protein
MREMPDRNVRRPARALPVPARAGVGLRGFAALSVLLAAPLLAQTPPAPTPPPGAGQEMVLKITKEAGRKLPLAVPPLSATGVPAMQSKIVEPFTATLRSDLDYTGVFVIADPAHYPSGSRDPSSTEVADAWRGTGAEILVDTRADVVADKVTVEARIWDLKAHQLILGRRYSGGVSYVERIAHTLANDLVKEITGKSGLFLSTVVFVSDRDKGHEKDLYAMDFDGRNVRRLTMHHSLVLNPDARGGKIVFTSYQSRFPQIWMMNADGSGAREIRTGVELNASPTLSPDGTQIAFAGSAKGNADIYVVNTAGGNLRRLTMTHALEAAPDWSPTGRQILYTSDQSGTPQLWVMDSEGTDARRLTYAGNWNDEGAWSPDGSKVAFACRNEGDFNICVMDLATGNTVQLTSEGSNSHPGWSPNGEKIVYQTRRGGSTQIYTMDADGQNKRQLTEASNNTQPIWMP